MIYYENSRTDPTFNLAAEEYFLKEPTENEPIFLLWQNAPSVIIGRNQNALEEINIPFIEENGIAVVRRLSGGGAVYHDLGNLNFTFIVPDDSFRPSPSGGPDFEFFTRPVSILLRRLGLAVEFTGRNDLTLEGKKFSGNAQARSGGRLLHHGTLLFSTDFEKMTAALHVTPDKFVSKGVASIRSRVMNLADRLPTDWTMDDFKGRLIDEIEESRGDALRVRPFSPDQLSAIETLRREKYATRAWNFGKSPKSNFHAERRFPWGRLRVDLFLERGKIGDVTFSGDFFSLAPPENLASALTGLDYEMKTLTRAVSDEKIHAVFPDLTNEDFWSLLFE